MEDFYKPKLIYPNMTKFLPFIFDNEGFLTNQKCFIITGENIEFLTAFLNSSIFKFCFRDNFPELQGGTRELSKIFFEEIPVLKVTTEINKKISSLLLEITKLKAQDLSTIKIEDKIENLLSDLYDLNECDRKIIKSMKI